MQLCLRNRRIMVVGAIALAAAAALWANLRPGSRTRFMAGLIGSALGPEALPSYDVNRLDQFLLAACPRGNLYIAYRGFDPEDARDYHLLNQYYLRSVYVLYPRSVFVNPDDIAILHPRDLVRANGVPSRDWLRQHDVRSVIYLEKKDGEIERLVQVFE